MFRIYILRVKLVNTKCTACEIIKRASKQPQHNRRNTTEQRKNLYRLECIKAVTDNSICCLIWKRRISDKSSVIRIDLSVEESTVKVELIQKPLKML
ncbi:Ribonuclease [Trichinella spiralis]|uniref:Ribonuclease n=1 Tax=Trichinella spiralis TaxID=6334 RepID=A0ABR3KPT1_TRISP